MRKKLVLSLMILALVCMFSMVTNAGSWTITDHWSYTYYTSWERVYTAYNYSYSQDSFSYTYSDSKTVTISAEVGLDEVVSAKIGVSAGQTVTKSYTYNGTLPARSYRYLDSRWAWKKDYGYADYYGASWNPFDNDRYDVYWWATTPSWIEMQASQAYSL